MAEAADAEELTGATITGTSGERLGTISEVAADPDTQRPAWARVHVGFSGGRSAVVPLSEARRTRHGDPWVPYTKAQLLSAPLADSLTDLGPDTEWALLEHYGLAGGDPERTAVPLPAHLADQRGDRLGEPAGEPGPGRAADDAAGGPRPGGGTHSDTHGDSYVATHSATQGGTHDAKQSGNHSGTQGDSTHGGGTHGDTQGGPDSGTRAGGRHRAAGSSRSWAIAAGTAVVLLIVVVGLSRRSRSPLR